jgi:hypothetical protein
MIPMSIESWFVLTVAAAFLLLGVAGSPLAWVALHHRKSKLEKLMEERWNAVTAELHRLEGRLALAEGASRSANGKRELGSSQNGTKGGSLPSRPFLSSLRRSAASGPVTQEDDTSLISVPNLASSADDRRPSSSPLDQRYAAIWSLADQGASPEVIAKATGHPIGQIELILSLRRHIDGSRATIPHAPHG